MGSPMRRNQREPEDTVMVNVRNPHTMLAQIDEVVDAEERNRGWVIKNIIRRYFEETP